MDFEEDTEDSEVVSILDLQYAIQQLRDDFVELRRRYSAQNTVMTGLVVRIKRMEQDITLLKSEIQSQGLRLNNLSNHYQRALLKSSGDENDR